MRRINTKSKAVDLWGAGKHGFTAGNAQSGFDPTGLSADFFNDVQENICHPIEYSGGTLGSDTTQLTKAIQRLYRNWNPDLIGSAGTPATFRTHSHGDERDTWVNLRGTVTGLKLTGMGNQLLLPELTATGLLSGNIDIVYISVDNPVSMGYYKARLSWLHYMGATLIASSTVIDDTVPAGGNGITIEAVGDNPAPTISFTADAWNVLLHYDMNFVTLFNP
jgi:hypothetical protein